MMQIKKNIAISESGFVFDPGSGESYSLNQSGLEIISMIRQGKSMEEITGFFTSKYDVEASSFERYYYDFIATLKHNQLLENYA
jgi:PqqD family protein of HPr-rel-A system